MYTLLYKAWRFTALFFLGAWILFCFTSCADEDEPGLSGAGAVSFTTSIWSEGDNASSRVIDQTWSGNENVGIYMLSPGESTVPDNVEWSTYFPSGGKGGTSVDLVTTGTPLYYPMNGDKVNFVAFSPHKQPSMITSGNTMVYRMAHPGSGMSKENMEAMDLIWCKTSSGYNHSSGTGKDGKVNLAFEHQFSKIEITVERDASLGTDLGVDFSMELMLSLNNIPGTVIFDLNSGTIVYTETPTATNQVAFYKDLAKSSASKAVFMAIVAPHTNKGTLTFDGIRFSPPHTYTWEQEFKKNTCYTYSFTLAQKEVTLTSAKITDWVSGSNSWDDRYNIQVSSSVTVPKEAFGHVLSFKTNCPQEKGITVRKSSKATGVPDNNVSWIILNSSGVERNNNLTSDNYLQQYSVLANNTGAPRTGYLHITAGSLTAVVEVTQEFMDILVVTMPEANCYILPPGGHTIRIPVSIIQRFADLKTGGVPHTILPGYAIYPYVVWSDVARDGASMSSSSTHNISPSDVEHYNAAVAKVEADGTGPNAYIKVTSGTKPGNVLVAVSRSGDATIHWSWHIWVTDYNPDATAHEYTSTGSPRYYTTFMDRNLGATTATPGAEGSLGLLYQWGRKDPFPGANTAKDSEEKKVWVRNSRIRDYVYEKLTDYTDGVSKDGSRVYIHTTINNPITFYWRDHNGQDPIYDWSLEGAATINGTRTRWMAMAGVKAIDDPCPPGWRVPSYGDNKLSNNIWEGIRNQDFNWVGGPWYGKGGQQVGWWPAGGYKDGLTGMYSQVSTSGYYWYANNDGLGIYADEFAFNSAGSVHFDQERKKPRAYGNFIRCCKL